MRDLIRPFAFLSIIPLAATSIIAEETSEMWQRAVEICQQSIGAVATKIEVRSELRDEQTGVSCRRTQDLSLRSVSAGGEPDWHIVSTEEVFPSDANPDTACELDIGGHGELVVPVSGMGPLMQNEQRRVRVEGVLGERQIGDRQCVVHGFRWKRKLGSRRRYEGEACLDTVTGAPLEVRFWPRNNYRGNVSAVTTLRYSAVEGTGWVIVEFDVLITESLEVGAPRHFEFSAKASGHRPASELVQQ